MSYTLTLFRVGGIPVRVHVSWLAIFGLIAWSLAVGYFPRVLPDVPVLAHWVQGFLAALLLFVSVFLHELAHSVVARAHGLPVSGITLHVFGGVSQLEREPDRPGVELKMAIVGPLTSFALAALAAVGASLAASRPATGAVLRYLAAVNAIVGAFNLVPGFPLDGGRILRALLWRVKGDVRWATEIASRAGTVIAFVLMALGVLRALSGEFLGGLWFVLIGLFLRQAAEGTYQQLLVRRALGPVAVRDVMSQNVLHVPPDLPLDRVADEWFWRHHVTSFPVVEDRRLLGILSIAQLGAVPRERWAEVRAREVMRPVDDALTIEPTARLPAALEKLTQNGLGRLAVVEKGGIVGYLSLKDALHVLAVATAGGFKGERSARPRPAGDERSSARSTAG